MEYYWMARVAGTLMFGAASPPVEFAPGQSGRPRAKIVIGDLVSKDECERKVVPRLRADLEKMGFQVDVERCIMNLPPP